MQEIHASWLEEARAYVDECGERSICVRASEFATRVQRTPAQLAREFHSAFGFCVKDYFTSLQIARARELLLTTTRSTAVIAARAGFGTARSFYRAFRRNTGVSPTEYRKEMSLAAILFRH